MLFIKRKTNWLAARSLLNAAIKISTVCSLRLRQLHSCPTLFFCSTLKGLFLCLLCLLRGLCLLNTTLSKSDAKCKFEFSAKQLQPYLALRLKYHSLNYHHFSGCKAALQIGRIAHNRMGCARIFTHTQPALVNQPLPPIRITFATIPAINPRHRPDSEAEPGTKSKCHRYPSNLSLPHYHYNFDC